MAPPASHSWIGIHFSGAGAERRAGEKAPQRRVGGRGEASRWLRWGGGELECLLFAGACEWRAEETKERGRSEITGVGKRLAQGEPPTAPQTKADWA